MCAWAKLRMRPAPRFTSALRRRFVESHKGKRRGCALHCAPPAMTIAAGTRARTRIVRTRRRFALRATQTQTRTKRTSVSHRSQTATIALAHNASKVVLARTSAMLPNARQHRLTKSASPIVRKVWATFAPSPTGTHAPPAVSAGTASTPLVPTRSAWRTTHWRKTKGANIPFSARPLTIAWQMSANLALRLTRIAPPEKCAWMATRVWPRRASPPSAGRLTWPLARTALLTACAPGLRATTAITSLATPKAVAPRTSVWTTWVLPARRIPSAPLREKATRASG
mmetsp:Transcript_3545/g.4150  ORF Transcript_3545/g.4150 Transcript_3545/m.4150 type:complete len:284 (+) Transcript_3545:517-1368(+)